MALDLNGDGAVTEEEFIREEAHTPLCKKETEEKAKVVAAFFLGGGSEFLKLLAPLAILHQDKLKNLHPILQLVLVHNIPYSSNRSGAQ